MPSEGAGHRGPLMGRSGLSTQWDCHCWAPQEAVDPTALSSAPGFHMWDSLALNAIPATASPVHSRVGGGFPVALQRNSANCPGCTVSCGGWMETMGAAGAAEACTCRVAVPWSIANMLEPVHT